MTEFKKFPKIPRFHADCQITEKIDGTNAQILIAPWDPEAFAARLSHRVTHTLDPLDVMVLAGSRKRYIIPEADNHSFARWVHDNAETLATLDPGRYYGEWWGHRIQRGYDLDEKRFTSFKPVDCDLMHNVPILYEGPFDPHRAYECLWDLKENGSRAAPGYMDPEGIVIYFPATHASWKLTFKDFVAFDRFRDGDCNIWSTLDTWHWHVEPRTYHKSQEKKS